MELTEEITKYEKEYTSVSYRFDSYESLSFAARGPVYCLYLTFDDKKQSRTVKVKMTEEEWNRFKTEVNHA